MVQDKGKEIGKETEYPIKFQVLFRVSKKRKDYIMTYTPKQRMLNAYRGIFSDRYPVAPEFWSYYPAKVLGVDMITFEREVVLFKALQATFKKYNTEGWCDASPRTIRHNAPEKKISALKKISSTQYRQTTEIRLHGRTFPRTRIFDINEPSWVVEYPVKDEADLPLYIDSYLLSPRTYDFTSALKDYNTVGEDYLLELGLGVPFFDVIADCMGFEKAILYVMSEDSHVLESFLQKYIESKIELVNQTCVHTSFESFGIGCSYSCNSLIGPVLWRKWDKRYLKAIAQEVHKHGRLLHVHFHGRCMETVADFAEIGMDCVDPFERPPGGDVDGFEGLKKVRNILGGKVTVSGNVHTVETLIRGNPEMARAEVKEIKEAFKGEPRLIIGTGDQVGKETPEENIQAMIEEGKKD